METFKCLYALRKNALPIIILTIIFGVASYAGTVYTFTPHYTAEYQFTVNFDGSLSQDSRNSDWFASTVQGWLEAAGFRAQLPFGYQVKKNSWQNLIISTSDPVEETLFANNVEIEKLLFAEIAKFNEGNPSTPLVISNVFFATEAAVSHPIRNTAFGVILALILGAAISFVREEID